MSDIFKKDTIIVVIALSFIAVTLLVINEWVLGRLLSPDGRIQSLPIRLAIASFDLVMLAAAYRIIKKRDSIAFPGLSKANIMVLVFSTLISLAGAEAVLRAKGFVPKAVPFEEVPSNIVGSDKNVLIADPQLGHKQRPGDFNIAITKSYSFHATHLNGGQRITKPLEAYDTESRKEQIWIFGCSFTYGWSLNNNETYPWLVQQNLPDYEIVNYGVIAYGTVHSYIQLQRELRERPKPRIAVLAYASFHDERNANLRTRQKRFAMGGLSIFHQPCARINRNREVTYTISSGYTPLPLMQYLALARATEMAYDQIEGRLVHSREISKGIVRDFAELCKKNDIQLIVAGIMPDYETADMLNYAREQLGVPAVDISVDLNAEGNRNLPYNGHPSFQANKQYAEKLETFLRKSLAAS